MNNFDINALIEMYHANIRSIEHLQYSNGEIRNAIIELINQRNSINTRRNIYNDVRVERQPTTTNYNYNHRRETNNRNTRNNSRDETTTDRYPDNRNHRTSSRPIQPHNTPVLNPRTTNTNTYNTIIDHIFRNNNYSNTFLDPVVVRPTAQQIERATRNVRYRDILRPTNSSCPITLDAFSDEEQVTMIRRCGHIFSQSAFDSWFRSNCRCPVCRYDIRSENNQESLRDISGNNLISRVDASANYWDVSGNTYTRVDVSGNLFDSSGNYVDASGNIYSTYDITSMTFSFFTTDNMTNDHLEEPE